MLYALLNLVQFAKSLEYLRQCPKERKFLESLSNNGKVFQNLKKVCQNLRKHVKTWESGSEPYKVCQNMRKWFRTCKSALKRAKVCKSTMHAAMQYNFLSTVQKSVARLWRGWGWRGSVEVSPRTACCCQKWTIVTQEKNDRRFNWH